MPSNPDKDRQYEKLVEDYYNLLEAYGLDDDELEAESTSITINSMVSFVQVTELLQSKPDAYRSAVADLRLHFLGELWVDDRLNPSWARFIDQVFPGDPLTSKDLEGFISAAAERLLKIEEDQVRFNQAMEVIFELLEVHEYEPDDEDVDPVKDLTALLAFFWHARGAWAEQWPVERQVDMFREKAMEVIANSSDPGHEVWPRVLDLFKAAPQEQR